MNYWTFRPLAMGGLTSLLLLGGCAQMVRDDVTEKIRKGDFETAIQDIQEGLVKYPNDTGLRASLISVQSEATSRLLSQAIQYRGLGRFDDADNALIRALAMDPKNERIMALQNDITQQRRAEKRLDEALNLLNDKKKEQALRVVELGLKDTPRQPELLALQRRLEGELRAESEPGGRNRLAESRPISLDFRGAPLSTVLDAITRGSGINFILDRDVKQDNRVTLFLRSARVDDAIDLVAGANQLAQRIIDPQTVLIYPNTPEKQREHQEQVIRVFHLGNADAKSTATLLRSMLRIKDPFVDEKANLIALRESPEIIALAERLVALHDMGDAEVMLEVEILEIKTTRLLELGINFPNTFTLTPLPLPGATGLTVSSLRSINSDRIGVGVGGILVNLRREVGDFNILANPRIRAKNREKAKILIGDKVPVVTASSTAAGFLAESISYLDVGIKLDVEPTVSPDDEVTIKLGLEVSSLAKEVRTVAGSLAYQIGTRNANTVLRLKDGETQLLAGLISNEDRSSANRVPGLGDLPVLGRLFSSQKDDYQRTELILAITPRILRTAPRPDITQSEMWVGSEMATRLRPAPARIPFVPASGTETRTVGVAPSATVVAALQSSAPPPLAAGISRAPVPAGPIQASWQVPAEVKAGTEFTVNLSLSSAAALRGAPLEISFPTQSLEVLDVAEGGFFKQSGATTSFTHTVNTTTGRIGAGILSNDSGGAMGQGTLLQLRLKAKAPGPVDLNITSLKPIALSGQAPIAPLPALRIEVK